AERLRHLSGSERAGEGRAIGGYLRLMAVLADAQQSTLTTFAAPRPDAEALRLARAHGMPPVHAASLTREASWRGVLAELCSFVLGSGEFPTAVGESCMQLQEAPVVRLEAQADALLAGRVAEV